MPDESTELRKVAWSQVFPFVRLFRTFNLAINYERLALAFICVLVVYLGGRVLDRVWIAAGGGVPVAASGGRAVSLADISFGPAAHNAGLTELDVFHSGRGRDLAAWRRAVVGERESLERREVELAKTVEQRDLREAPAQLTEWLADKLNEIDKDTDVSTTIRDERRAAARRSADALRFGLDTRARGRFGEDAARQALRELVPADKQADFARLLDYAALRQRLDATALRGPFAVLLSHELRCFAAAVQGVAGGRLGFGGGPESPEPTLLGSLAAAGSGVTWLVTERSCYTAFYGLLLLAVFGLGGGALCRHAAVQAARDEALGLGAALAFGRSKWKEFVLAPLMPVGILVIGAVLLMLGGIVGAIPVIGHVLSSLLYGLALLGGFALALVLIGLVLGLHLMWPTIAVENSDAFDAVSRAFGYILQRIWHAVFYTVVLLVYGGLSLLMVRLMALLTLKLTHAFTSVGFNFFGGLTSAQTSTVPKLDALWSMPAWSELTLLPTVHGPAFWGSLWTAPLSTTEWLAAWIIALWVFTVVGLVCAFTVSFFFCGSTQMYFLLRRDVDATDWDEIFYEETDTAPSEPVTEAGATLPVVPPPAPPADETPTAG